MDVARTCKNLKIALSVAAAVAGLSGFGSCTPSLHEVCSARFPEFDAKMEGAIAALEPWRGTYGRSVASLQESFAAPSGLAAEDRESWLHWAEQRLGEAQFYIDALSGEAGASPLRAQLSEIANQLVTFHGYASVGQVDRMLRTLERIRKSAARARTLACGR